MGLIEPNAIPTMRQAFLAIAVLVSPLVFAKALGLRRVDPPLAPTGAGSVCSWGY
jgi:hypothetical protein